MGPPASNPSNLVACSRFKSLTDFPYKLASDVDEPVPLETAHVLFTDIVGYSGLMIDEQSRRLQRLQVIVRSTREFQRADGGEQLIRLPTSAGYLMLILKSSVDYLTALSFSRFSN